MELFLEMALAAMNMVIKNTIIYCKLKLSLNLIHNRCKRLVYLIQN